MRNLKILVGCEESQAVTKEFRSFGHEAYSCDLVPCSGGHPEWHLQCDVFEAIKGGSLRTQDATEIFIDKWDGGIFHPTCTFLTNSGVRWLFDKYYVYNVKRWEDLRCGIDFFNKIIRECHIAGIQSFALENPIPHKYGANGWDTMFAFDNTIPEQLTGIGKYDQLIQPYQFGHLEKKATCLWLDGLPPLEHTNNVYEEMMQLPYAERAKIHYASPGPERAKIRSKTYSGIAKAMAEQWSEYLLNNIP